MHSIQSFGEESMFAIRCAAIPVLVSLVFTGCTHLPATQPVQPEVLAAMQPVEVKVGISQSELYAAFVRSNAAASGAAACAAVPGLGILLAAACGGAMGAVDASVNATRAKAAEESVRPLKDEMVDMKFDQLMNESLAQALQSVSGMQVANVAVTKVVNTQAYEKTFTAATSNAVMFVNVDYHMSVDFSTLEVSARSLLYPRGTSARTAAKQPATLSTTPSEPVLAPKNAVYRSSIVYRAKHPAASADATKNIEAWKADNARMLKTALQDGITQAGALLAADLQRKYPAYEATTAKADAGNGLKANLVSQSNGGRLLRYPDGSLNLDAVPIMAAATPVLPTTPASNTAAPAAVSAAQPAMETVAK
ncbi:hypothetical protein [Variovorax sp. AFSI2.2]|uniref:hypothetical protein n=1 Tax=Variovorax sp. AFSI2.2 TaxID=3384160 RepID=UPI003EB8E363